MYVKMTFNTQLRLLHQNFKCEDAFHIGFAGIFFIFEEFGTTDFPPLPYSDTENLGKFETPIYEYCILFQKPLKCRSNCRSLQSYFYQFADSWVDLTGQASPIFPRSPRRITPVPFGGEQVQVRLRGLKKNNAVYWGLVICTRIVKEIPPPTSEFT